MKNKVMKALDNIGYVLLWIALPLIATSWLWLPPLWAQLAYGDWSCAYKECVVIKEKE